VGVSDTSAAHTLHTLHEPHDDIIYKISGCRAGGDIYRFLFGHDVGWIYLQEGAAAPPLLDYQFERGPKQSRVKSEDVDTLPSDADIGGGARCVKLFIS
jgi:hypothetical protein